MIRWQRKGKERHYARTFLIRSGIVLATISGLYLLFGIAGLLPLATEPIAWNNIRMVSGATIFGCLMAAVGYGNE